MANAWQRKTPADSKGSAGSFDLYYSIADQITITPLLCKGLSV